MNDTHGETGQGWYGFDLDGTLAKYDGWKGENNIGEPVVPMVRLIKEMHEAGKVVKIMTARVAPKSGQTVTYNNPYLENHWCIQEPTVQTWAMANYWTAKEFIQEWCYRNLGFVPEIVYQKDHLMLELYDDRVKQVVPNEGWLVEDIATSKRKTVTIDRVKVVDAKWWDRLNWFFIGIVFAGIAWSILSAWMTKPLPEATEKLHEAIHEFMKSQRWEAR